MVMPSYRRPDAASTLGGKNQRFRKAGLGCAICAYYAAGGKGEPLD
jgi:hypothetical protein